MDGAPQKLTDVTFDECRRGYDPEQVDTYLEKVSQAVDQLKDLLRDALARAEGAEARLAQAKRAQNDAESARAGLQEELDAAKAELAAASAAVAAAPAAAAGAATAGSLDSDELAKVLLLAQRTADQTVAEAKADAKKVVSEARAEATRLVVDAERQRDEVLKAARDEARELVEKEAAGLEDTVDRLEARRDELQGDLSVLTKYVDEQRRQLAGALEKLRRVLEDPAEFRVAPAPVLKTAKPSGAPSTPAGARPSGASTPSSPSPSPSPSASGSPTPPATPAAAPATSPPATPPATAPGLGKATEAPRSPSASLRSEPRSADRPSAVVGNAALAVVDDPAPAPPVMRAVPDLEPDEVKVAPATAAPEEPSPVAAVPTTDQAPTDQAPTDEASADGAALDDGGPATERYDVLANDTGEVAAVLAATSTASPELAAAVEAASAPVDDDDLFLELERAAGTPAQGDGLGAVDDGGDDAIRAFFDSEDDPGRRWFGRRR